MAVNLKDFARPLVERPVPFRGGTIPVRRLTAADDEAMERQWPMPRPEKGLDERHPAYVARYERWLTVRNLAVVGRACGIADGSGEVWSAGWDGPRLCRYADWLAGELTTLEVNQLREAVLEMKRGCFEPATAIGTGEQPGN